MSLETPNTTRGSIHEAQTKLLDMVRPIYESADGLHGMTHINEVLCRTAWICGKLDISPRSRTFMNSIFAAILHDVTNLGHGRKDHHNTGAEWVLQHREEILDIADVDIDIIASAVREHRATYKGEYSSIVSTIVSAADRRRVTIGSLDIYVACYHIYRDTYNQTHKQAVSDSHLLILEKYGPHGYAYANNELYRELFKSEMDETALFVSGVTVGEVEQACKQSARKSASKDFDKAMKKLITRVTPKYNKNDELHKIDHAIAVRDTTMQICEHLGIDKNSQTYRSACFAAIVHDVELALEGRKNHHLAGYFWVRNNADYLLSLADVNIDTIAYAVLEHRASYTGSFATQVSAIISTADRKRIVPGSLSMWKACYRNYRQAPHNLNHDEAIESTHFHLNDKYGEHGYAYGNNVLYNDIFKDEIAETKKFVASITLEQVGEACEKYRNMY